MQAFEFEATAQQQTLRLLQQIPNGVRLRVLVLVEEDPQNTHSASPIAAKPLHKPAPQLAGSVMMVDDLLAPAVPEEAWSALQ